MAPIPSLLCAAISSAASSRITGFAGPASVEGKHLWRAPGEDQVIWKRQNSRFGWTGSHWLAAAEEATLQRFPYGLRARVYVQPLVDFTDMGSYCVQADIQSR